LAIDPVAHLAGRSRVDTGDELTFTTETLVEVEVIV
jgi:hypothetical protein